MLTAAKMSFGQEKKTYSVVIFIKWGRGGGVVSPLYFRSDGLWFEAQTLPSCCFLRRETLLRIVSFKGGASFCYFAFFCASQDIRGFLRDLPTNTTYFCAVYDCGKSSS